jgi:SAM-dependent methyltransferase
VTSVGIGAGGCQDAFVHDDARRWDERYRTTTHVDAQQPEVIERWPDVAGLLPSTGRCLDIASGPGSVTLWSAERGLDVTALDASPVAIDLLRSAATALGCSERVDARVVDLDDGLPADAVDYDLVICQRYRDPTLSPMIVDRLRVGGYALVTVLSAVGAAQPGAFHAPAGALWSEFSTDRRCAVLHHEEGDGVAHIVVRRR